MRSYEKYSRNNRRLQGFDYRSSDFYFITICTKNRAHYFGEIKNQKMYLSDEGIIVRDYWLDIAKYKPNVHLGEFVIMPDHLHGLIGLDSSAIRSIHTALPCKAATTKNSVQNLNIGNLSPKSGSVSRIIGSFKSACTRMIRQVSTEPFAWQNHFHDRIIRDQRELKLIETYIKSNIEKWQEDKRNFNNA